MFKSSCFQYDMFSLSYNIKGFDFIKINKILENDAVPKVQDSISRYDTIYAMSDIHADYVTFVTYLINFGIVGDNINQYIEKNVYDSRIITELKWTAGNKKVLVICGDIVDGKRYDGNTEEYVEVHDDRGFFEILLHMFLRNLKIAAKKAK